MSLADVEAAAEALNRAVTAPWPSARRWRQGSRSATSRPRPGSPGRPCTGSCGPAVGGRPNHAAAATSSTTPSTRSSSWAPAPPTNWPAACAPDRLDAKTRRVQHGARIVPPGAQLTDEINRGILAAAEILKPR